MAYSCSKYNERVSKMSVFSTSYITSPKEGNKCISFNYSEFAGRGFIELLEKSVLVSHPNIFNKIIDGECVEFSPYLEFYSLSNDEVKLVVENVDNYLCKNIATTEAELFAKTIWEGDIRTSLIEISF